LCPPPWLCARLTSEEVSDLLFDELRDSSSLLVSSFISSSCCFVNAVIPAAVAAGAATAVGIVVVAGLMDAVLAIVLQIPRLHSDKVSKIPIMEPVVL
jgi:hypothetical protein